MENTENKTDEVEILVNTGYGGFRPPSIAKVWLMQLGYTSDQAMYMGRGDCPRDLPDLVEAFKRYGNDHYSSIEVHTLPRGAAFDKLDVDLPRDAKDDIIQRWSEALVRGGTSNWRAEYKKIKQGK